MNEYFYTIIILSVLGSIVSSIIAQNSPVKRYVRLTLGLICILCMLSPMIKLVSCIDSLKESVSGFLSELFEGDEMEKSNQLIIDTGKESVEKSVKDAILQKFSFEESEIAVNIELDERNINAITIKQINITLMGKASWSDGDKIKKYVEDIIGGNVRIKRG